MGNELRLPTEYTVKARLSVRRAEAQVGFLGEKMAALRSEELTCRSGQRNEIGWLLLGRGGGFVVSPWWPAMRDYRLAIVSTSESAAVTGSM